MFVRQREPVSDSIRFTRSTENFTYSNIRRKKTVCDCLVRSVGVDALLLKSKSPITIPTDTHTHTQHTYGGSLVYTTIVTTTSSNWMCELNKNAPMLYTKYDRFTDIRVFHTGGGGGSNRQFPSNHEKRRESGNTEHTHRRHENDDLHCWLYSCTNRKWQVYVSKLSLASDVTHWQLTNDQHIWIQSPWVALNFPKAHQYQSMLVNYSRSIGSQ